MERNVLRALLLAMTVLLVGALPVAAQSEEEGWQLTSEDGVIAIEREVAVGATEQVDYVAIASGEALIEGSVERLWAADADVILRGPSAEVEQAFTAGGSLSLEGGAAIGDLYYAGTEVTIDALSAVEGEFVDAEEEFAGALAAIVFALVVIGFILLIGAIIAALAMTLLVIAFGTDQTRRAAATISNDVLKTIVVGVLALFVPNLIFIGLAVTVVGIPLAIVLWTLWTVVAFLGQVVVAVWIGERILPRARTAARPYGAAFLGMIILILLWWTAVVPLLAGIFGTGAVTLAGWRMLRGGGAPPVPPGYGDQYGQPMQVPPPPYAPPPYAPPPPQGGWPPQGGQPPGSWPQG
ncbi:MAG: hypothetical protein AB1Z67_00850 [Candidatus Limnocylindrales bacterium]